MSASKAVAAAKPEPVELRPKQSGKRNVSGVWMVYRVSDEYGYPIVLSPHPEELEARRAAMDGGDGLRVVFVSWGQSTEGALAK